MLRKAFRMSVHRGHEGEYERRHRPIWSELEAALRDHGVHSYSIFLDDASGDLFAYAELDSEERWRALASTEVCRRWWVHMRELMPANPDASPVSRDLREVYAALRISADIERIGDYAANVAKRSIVLNQTAPVSAARGLPALAKLANTLVREAVEAYGSRDAERAMAVRSRDAELDAEYTGLFRELLTYMAEDPRQITACTHLLFMAKNIERIGDHATNIAENTWFLVHGEQPAEEREKRDLTSQ